MSIESFPSPTLSEIPVQVVPEPPLANTSDSTVVSASSTTVFNSWLQFLYQRPWLLGVALLVFVFVGLLSFRQSSITPQLVTTQGTATLQFPSDQAVISILYSSQGSDRRNLTERSEAEFALISSTIKTFSISTFTMSSYQLAPTSSTNGAQTFEYRQAAQIKLSGEENIAALQEYLRQANVYVIQTRYSPKDEVAVREQLMAAAAKDARLKAETLAKAAGKRLGSVHTINEVSVPTDAATITTVQQADLPIAQSAGQVELQMAVNISYQLW